MNREFCWKCGAKLLVASGPAASDVGIPMMEEHVLERISALEYSLGMVNKRVDSLIDTIERVAASNFIDHTMIETLTAVPPVPSRRSGAFSLRRPRRARA